MSASRAEFEQAARGLREFKRSLSVPAAPKLAAVPAAALARGDCPISFGQDLELDKEPAAGDCGGSFDR